jgi:hypothetical protein
VDLKTNPRDPAEGSPDLPRVPAPAGEGGNSRTPISPEGSPAVEPGGNATSSATGENPDLLEHPAGLPGRGERNEMEAEEVALRSILLPSEKEERAELEQR